MSLRIYGTVFITQKVSLFEGFSRLRVPKLPTSDRHELLRKPSNYRKLLLEVDKLSSSFSETLPFNKHCGQFQVPIPTSPFSDPVGVARSVVEVVALYLGSTELKRNTDLLPFPIPLSPLSMGKPKC